jgi:hypothetical protein
MCSHSVVDVHLDGVLRADTLLAGLRVVHLAGSSGRHVHRPRGESRHSPDLQPSLSSHGVHRHDTAPNPRRYKWKIM